METLQLVYKWWKTWHTLPVYAWVRGASLYRSGNFTKAEELYRRGLKRFPKHPAQYCARLDLSYCQFKLGNFESAETELKNIIKELPQSREAYLRLARLQVWRGQSLEASWTMRRALRNMPADAELAALFLFSALDARGPQYLIAEAYRAVDAVKPTEGEELKLAALQGRALMSLRSESSVEYHEGRTKLAQLSNHAEAPFEAVILFAEVLIEEGKIAHARRLLRRSLRSASEYPRLLSLLAETYLKSGPFYNADFARQLATTACQNTSWSSPREMHVLAESYFHIGDKISALVIASKAKELGSKLLGTYRHVKTLDQLIESLSTGTQA